MKECIPINLNITRVNLKKCDTFVTIHVIECEKIRRNYNMKKVFAMLFATCALALTACQPNVYTASDSESKLKANGYTAEVLTYEVAKARITGLNYDIVSFKDAVFAEKGSGENHDLFIAFYFASIDDASKFISANNYENHGILDDYAAKNLGEKLNKKSGTHNNVAYVGSETSFSVAFN